MYAPRELGGKIPKARLKKQVRIQVRFGSWRGIELNDQKRRYHSSQNDSKTPPDDTGSGQITLSSREGKCAKQAVF